MSDLFAIDRDGQGGLVITTNDRDLVADITETVVDAFKSPHLLGLRYKTPTARETLPDRTLILARLTPDEAYEFGCKLIEVSAEFRARLPLTLIVSDAS
jgi:hypothetical protein